MEKILTTALEPTANEYFQNANGQGADLARATKALAGAGASICEVGSKTVEIFLDPFRVAIYGYDRIKEKFIPKLQRLIEGIPSEDLTAPDEEIVGSILEAVRFKTNNEEISDLFAALLASAMNTKEKDIVHPAYIQIINEISSDEAKIIKYFATSPNLDVYPMLNLNAGIKGEIGASSYLKHFSDLGFVAGCAQPTLIPTYVDNLCRLKLFDVPFGTSITNKERYVPLKEHALLKPWLDKIIQSNRDPRLEETVLQLSPFGSGFIKACKLKTIPDPATSAG